MTDPVLGQILRREELDELARLFAAEVDASYISHSELKYGLATSPDSWSANLESLVGQSYGALLEDESAVIFTLRERHTDQLIGFAAVTWTLKVQIPFVVLEDLFIARSARGLGFAQALMNAVEDLAREKGATRIFLESGQSNARAHGYFESRGFQAVSTVFKKDLT